MEGMMGSLKVMCLSVGSQTIRMPTSTPPSTLYVSYVALSLRQEREWVWAQSTCVVYPY